MKEKKVAISHPGKVLFSEAGITKADLADFYGRIAAYLLPHIQGRPLTLRQFPQGIGESGFFSKHAPDHFPEYIRRIEVPMHSKPGKTMQMVTADHAEDLIYFAGQNTIELHMGLSRLDALDKPDQVIFDLDPSTEDFEKVRKVALALKNLLDTRGIPSFLKTTGSRGVHIHIPLEVNRKFEEVKPIAREIGVKLNKAYPGLTTLEQRKDKRGDRVFVDYLRNDFAMTAIAPYSLRALENAPVATPIDWDELKAATLGPQTYRLSNIFRRLAQKQDPWKGFHGHRIPLKKLSWD